jgi:hypothetical protein
VQSVQSAQSGKLSDTQRIPKPQAQPAGTARAKHKQKLHQQALAKQQLIDFLKHKYATHLIALLFTGSKLTAFIHLPYQLSRQVTRGGELGEGYRRHLRGGARAQGAGGEARRCKVRLQLGSTPF